MTKRKNYILLLSSIFITGLCFYLLYNYKIEKQSNELKELKEKYTLKIDSLETYKKYFQATHLYLEGFEQEANTIVKSIPMSDSLWINTVELLQNKSNNTSPKIILSQREKTVHDTIIAYDKVAISDLEKTKNDLEVAKSKLNELQMASGILNLTSSKGKKFQYIGQTKNGNAEGFGVGIFETGSIYKGYWQNNFRHGKGIFTWKDNEHYEGEFNNDKRDGYGEYHWKNGEVYKGFWKNDQRHGEGKLFKKNGKLKKEGIWQNDELVR